MRTIDISKWRYRMEGNSVEFLNLGADLIEHLRQEFGGMAMQEGLMTDAEVCERCFGGNLDNMVYAAANSPWSEIEVVEAPDGTYDLERP